jgi:hypothetical protein
MLRLRNTQLRYHESTIEFYIIDGTYNQRPILVQNSGQYLINSGHIATLKSFKHAYTGIQLQLGYYTEAECELTHIQHNS